MGKKLQWRQNMYYTHPMHTVIKNGEPVEITERQFKEKHCRKGNDGRRCQYLFIDRKGVMKK